MSRRRAFVSTFAMLGGSMAANMAVGRLLLWAGVSGWLSWVLLIGWGVVSWSVFWRWLYESRGTARNRRGAGPGRGPGPNAYRAWPGVTPFGALPPIGTGARWSGVPTRLGDEPIRAYKAALVLYEPGLGWRFVGVGMHAPYGVEETARCLRAGESATIVNGAGVIVSEVTVAEHPAPDLDCSCGFYAVKPEVPKSHVGYLGLYRGAALLEVELYGRVIVHELGYRAAKQRVLSAALPSSALPRCSRLSAGGGYYPVQCPAPAVYRYETGGSPAFACEVHAAGIPAHHRVAFDFLAEVRRDLPTDWLLLP